MQKVTCYIVRHGQTVYNQTGRVQGWKNSPLTEEGKKVAVSCGIGLKSIRFDAAYASDLERATTTAELILSKNNHIQPEVIQRKALREISFGHFDGGLNEDRILAGANVLLGSPDVALLNEKLSTKELRVRHLLNATYSIDESGTAETFEHLQERAVREIEAICYEAYEQQAKNILIVSHGVTIAAILDFFPGAEIAEISDIKNASVSKLTYDGEKIIVEEVGSMHPVQLGSTEQ